MNKNRFTAFILIFLFSFSVIFSGCGLTTETVLNVIAPTESPVPGANVSFSGASSNAPETVKYYCTNLNGVFSPFFAASDGDMQAVRLTQLSLMATAGNVGPAEIIETKHEDGSVTVRIALKDGITFSDGKEITSDDLIFTYYVLLDESYDGPYRVNTLAIRGIEEYRRGINAEYYSSCAEKYDNIYNGGKYKSDLEKALKDAQEQAREAGVLPDNVPKYKAVKTAQAALDAYDSDAAEEIKASIISAWKNDAVNLVNYTVNNFSATIELKTGYSKEAVLDSFGLQVMYTMIDAGFGTLNDGVLSAVYSDTTWDLVSTFPTSDDLFNEMYSAYKGDAETYWAIQGYGRGNMLADARDAVIRTWAERISGQNEAFRYISGIARIDEKTVEINLDYCDSLSMDVLCGIYIAPLHIYGNASQYDYQNSYFGFDKGDLSSVAQYSGLCIGAGEYVLSEYSEGLAELTPNMNYWLYDSSLLPAEIKANT